MKTLTNTLLATLIACGACAGLALAEPADAKDKDKTEKVKRMVVVRGGDGDEEVINLDDLGDGGPGNAFVMHAKRGFLGVSLTDLTPELRQHFGVPDDVGVMVSRVEPDSPAAKAGIKVGDIISGFGGKKVASSWDLTGKVRKMKDGEGAAIEVWRDRKVQNVSATIVEREKPQVDVRAFGPGNFVVPDVNVQIDQKKIDEMVQNMQKRFNSPEFQQRIQRQADLEKRLQEMEKKLQEMEKKLNKDSAR